MLKSYAQDVLQRLEVVQGINENSSVEELLEAEYSTGFLLSCIYEARVDIHDLLVKKGVRRGYE